MVNVLFCGNDGVFDGFLTCALSIVKRSASDEPFCFHIFTMDLTRIDPGFTALEERHASLLESVLRRYNPENRITVTDVTGLYESEFARCPNEGAYCSPYTLIRLLADLVDGMPDKLLYLDADILFNRDVRLLYDIDIAGYEYAAARDHYGKFLIRPGYVNAGVLLFNMKEMKDSRIFVKARGLLRAKRLPFADQSALNRATTRKLILPQRFNDQKFMRKHTVARHFSKRLFWLPYPHTENIKQWQVERVREVFGYNCFDDILDEYRSIIQSQ